MDTNTPDEDESGVAEELRLEEERARLANERAEQARQKRLAAKRQREKRDSKEQRELKARQLEDLLTKSAVCLYHCYEFLQADFCRPSRMFSPRRQKYWVELEVDLMARHLVNIISLWPNNLRL